MLPRILLQRGGGVTTSKLRPLLPPSPPPSSSSLPTPAGRRRRPFSSSSSSSTTTATADAWTTKDKAGLVLFGGLVVGTGTLGVWQAQRYYWKIDAIEERSAKLARQPEPLTE